MVVDNSDPWATLRPEFYFPLLPGIRSPIRRGRTYTTVDRAVDTVDRVVGTVVGGIDRAINGPG
eukprot:241767-Prorocentrum_minimum.AAC.1